MGCIDHCVHSEPGTMMKTIRLAFIIFINQLEKPVIGHKRLTNFHN